MELKDPRQHAIGTADRLLRMALVGRGIKLSRTPAMHEAEAEAQNLACRYDLIDTDAQIDVRLSDILGQAEADGFAGLNITYPYKREIIALLDELSDAARRVGSVNTVVFRDGRRFGHNTDFWGFSESLRRGLPDAALNTVLLIGAGGAGGAVGHALSDLGAGLILIADACHEVAERLAKAICASGGRAEPAADLSHAIARADGIVNATPVGMAKMPGTPFDTPLLTAGHWVAEIIYFPLETALLKAARARGCRTLSGEGMAVFQAVRAFELFTGCAASPDRMRATFRSLGPE